VKLLREEVRKEITKSNYEQTAELKERLEKSVGQDQSGDQC